MSDPEAPPGHPAGDSAPATPAVTPTKTTPKGKGRGRGRKKAALAKKNASTASTSAPNAAAAAAAASATAASANSKKVTGGRRGRTKQFDEDKIQASYERQRQLKLMFNELAQYIQPAATDLADREIEQMKQEPNYHKRVPEHHQVIQELDQRRDKIIAQTDKRLELDLASQHKSHECRMAAYAQIYQNGVDDKEDNFLDAQIRRLDILEELYDTGKPVDAIDDSWNYKIISDQEAAQFGPYEVYLDGVLVPYPQRVEGTEANALREATRAREAEEAAAAKLKVQPKAQPRRKAKDQAAVTTTTAAAAVASYDLAPVKHTQGVLAARSNADGSEEQSADSTPIPDGPAQPSENEPKLPNWASEPDEYGCRQVNRIPTKADIQNEKVIYNRIVVPPSFEFDPIEIGYRDSTNDPSRNSTLAKRGKYHGQNGTNTWHYDPMLARHDARLVEEEDMDEELVERYRVHPRYGYFLPNSKNPSQKLEDETPADRPTVFITPGGQTIHTSRVLPPAEIEEANRLKADQNKMLSSFAAYCEKEGIEDEEVEADEIRDLRLIRKAAEEARRQAAFRSPPPKSREPVLADDSPQTPEATVFAPSNEAEINLQGLAQLIDAAEKTEAMDAPEAPQPSPVAQPAETPVRAVTRKYDAIRDMVVETPIEPQVMPAPPPSNFDNITNTNSLSVLADICGQAPFEPVARTAKRSRVDEGFPPEAPSAKRMSFGPPLDEQYHQPARYDPPPTYLPPINESSARQPVYYDAHGYPPAPYEPHLQHRRESVDSYIDPYTSRPMQPAEMTPSYHGGPPPPRPIEEPSYPQIDPRLSQSEPYHLNHTRSQQPVQHEPPPPPRHSQGPRMPFSNPHAGPDSQSLPPLRPSQSYGEPINGFYPPGSATRPAPESPYYRMAPAPSHTPTPTYSGYPPPSPAPPSAYGNPHSANPPFANIAPSPSDAHSAYGPPILMPFPQQGQGIAPNMDFAPRGKSGSASSTPTNGRYRELAPAPLPAHRQGSHQAQELRTVQYVPGENIKDYTPTEQLPARGPQMVRSWNQYSGERASRSSLGGASSSGPPEHRGSR